MKKLNRFALLLLALAVANFANAMQIKAPDIVENGAVIPVEIILDQAMTAGQNLELIVNGEPAAQVRVMEGKLSRFSIRVKGSQNDTSIRARVITKGRELDSASRNVDVRITSPVSGSPTTAGPFRVRTIPGDLKILMESQNGFSDTFVVQDTGFRVLISGSRVITKNPFVGVMGEFSDRATAAIDEQTQWMPSNLVAPPANPSGAYVSVKSPGGNKWPAGVEPGNMYLVEDENIEWPQIFMVSAKSSQDALSTISRAAEEHRQFMGGYGKPRKFKVVVECIGPGWASTIQFAKSRIQVAGACGLRTPGEAIAAAAKECTRRGPDSCEEAGNVHVDVGHSGARGWNPHFSSIPSSQMNFAALAATSTAIDQGSFVSSYRDAIEKLGKVCGGEYGKRPCFIASTKWKCMNETSSLDLSSCVETRLTAAGYK